jgi:SAM-dependent methyltransferase
MGGPDPPGCYRTDYGRFDRRYETLRREGKPGWVHGEDWDFHLSWLEKALDAPYCPKAGSALEIGCGAGNWCVVLAQRGFDVTGVDISPKAIAWARERARREGCRMRFEVAGAAALLDWEPDRFDLVLDGFCLHCVIGADRAPVLDGVHRVLRPGGLFYVRCFAVEDLRSAECRERVDPATRVEVRDGVATRYVGRPSDIVAELEAHGFTILGSEIAPWGDGMLQIHATRR